MKKGKTTKLSGYRTFKSQFGTIDSTNLKSIFVNIIDFRLISSNSVLSICGLIITI